MELYNTRISRLGDHLINQIAAGEVVERPSSVVKELVENALDAGATRIDVMLKNGGIEEIQILDDGVGMSEPDLRLCVERHTTSKIRDASDLEAIRTFGFRGEALSSIASVSEMEIRSRQAGANSALVLRVNYGRVDEEVRPAGAPVGTCITVRGLFERVPARRKFLRSLATEFSHCARIVRELAMGNPEVAFSLRHQGQSVKTYSGETRATRFREGFTVDWEPLEILEEGSDSRLHAFLSPTHEMQDRGEMFVFVNRRSVRNRNFLSAARSAYLDTLGPHHEPSGVLYLDLRNDWVDVNVHPQKLEVRCLRQESIYPWIVSSIRKTISKHLPVREVVEEKAAPYSLHPAREISARLRYLGQVRATYLLCEDERGVVLVDQHALHEKRRFDELSLAFEQGRLGARSLPVPKVARLPMDLHAKIEERREGLRTVGFEVEPFGDGDVAIKSHPEHLPEDHLVEVLTEALGSAEESLARSVLASIARHSAVRAGQTLSSEEASELLSGLGDFDDGWACPHGRPVLFRLSYDVIKKHFERT